MRTNGKLNTQRLIVATWVLGVVCAVVLLLVTYGRTWRFDYHAKVTEFALCSGLDQVNKLPIPISHSVTTQATEINICGHLEGIGPIPLGFLWKYNGEVMAVERGEYYPGYFTARLAAPPEGFKVGKYLALVYLSRHDLASMEFTLVEQ